MCLQYFPICNNIFFEKCNNIYHFKKLFFISFNVLESFVDKNKIKNPSYKIFFVLLWTVRFIIIHKYSLLKANFSAPFPSPQIQNCHFIAWMEEPFFKKIAYIRFFNGAWSPPLPLCFQRYFKKIAEGFSENKAC